MPDINRTARRIVVSCLDHVAIYISEPDRARAFYGGLLGLREVPRPPTFDFPGMWYRIGSDQPGGSFVDLHLVGRPGQVEPPSRKHFCLWVNDVHAASELLAAHGYPVDWDRTKIAGIDRFFTRDPDHNRIEIQGWDREHT